MALTGTLADVRLDELASLLQQQQRTGLLRLSFSPGVVAIHFRDGLVCQADDSRRPPTQSIGELLVAGNCISRIELASALEEQRESNKPLGAILVGMSAVSLTDLHRYLDLQFRETLYPLFERTTGDFEFDAEGYVPRNCAPPPIPVEDVAMEAVRRIDELPELEAWVANLTTRFHALVPEIPSDAPKYISSREHEVFAAIGQIADTNILVARTCMSSFDVMKGLSHLYQSGYIRPVDHREWSHSALFPAVDGGTSSLSGRRTTLIRVTAQLFTTVAVVLLLGSLGIRYFLASWTPRRTLHQVTVGAQFTLETLENRNQVAFLDRAIEVYQLRWSDYPAELAELQQASWVLPYRSAVDWTLHYRRSGDGYILLPMPQ